MADYDMAIDLHPDYAAAYLCCGLTKYLKGDHEGAIVDLDRAVALIPDFPYVYFGRGSVKKAMGNQQGANEDYRQVHKLRALQRDYREIYIWLWKCWRSWPEQKERQLCLLSTNFDSHFCSRGFLFVCL